MQGMNVAKGGWYTEIGSMWPGQGLSLQVKEVLYKGRSKFQVRIHINFHVSKQADKPCPSCSRCPPQSVMAVAQPGFVYLGSGHV